MCFKNYSKTGKTVCIVLFAIYAAVLLRLTVFRDEVFIGSTAEGYRINLRPWAMYEYFLQTHQYFQYRYLLVGNFVCLMPLGFACPFFRSDSGLGFAAAVCVGTTVFIETWQLAFKIGYFELDDLVLNTLGGITGYALYRSIQSLVFKTSKKAQSAKTGKPK